LYPSASPVDVDWVLN